MQSTIDHSLSFDTAAAAESLSAMLQKEQTIYRIRDYLHPMQNSIIADSDRMKLVDWCYVVIDKCELDREFVAVTMELFDRFLSKPSIVAQEALRHRVQLQLVAVASLYIAIKISENATLGSDFFSALIHGIYSAEEIEGMEMSILKGLSWRVCAPTSIQVARHILSLMFPHVDLEESTWAFVLDEVQFQTEFAVRDYYFATQRQSTIALAAILNTLDQVDRQDRLAMYRALLSVMSEEFDSYENLLAARAKLLILLGDNDALADDSTVASDKSPREITECSSNGGPD